MKIILTIAAALLLQFPCWSQVRLPRLVRDSMVIQRDARVRIWGWASAGEKISVRFLGKNYSCKTDNSGKWSVMLAPTAAGGPYTMDIKGRNNIHLSEILVGDVWLCSGQSNMVHQMTLHSVRYAADIEKAGNPMIRHFWIPTLTSLRGPEEDLPAGSWKSANPADVLDFSAVAYFFARDIYERYHIPIGLINASVGGTPIEAWTSEEGLREFPGLLATITKNKDTAYVNTQQRAARLAMAARPNQINDKGLTGPLPWYDPNYLPKGWRRIHLPGFWEDQGLKDLNGVVWYRKEINLPASMEGKEARVFLGRIVDADVLYINGKQVGQTFYQYPQRRYRVPAGLLRSGKNLFVIKLTNTNGKGGFVTDKPYCIFSGKDTVDLQGDWDYQVGEVYDPIAGNLPAGIALQNQPAALFNAMIAPVTPYAIRGFLWYQGESNVSRADQYLALERAQVADWRKRWNQESLPYFFVQLPGFMDRTFQPVESQWAVLREAQRLAGSIPHTGMVIAIDLGEWNDIHPDRKKEVGDRLALLARRWVYGDSNLVCSGPLFSKATLAGDSIVLEFTNTGSGLISSDGEALTQFAIAGADKKFVWARARIVGNTVVVSSERITAPRYVRYGWSDNPDGANLYNREGLPASPFRTDP